MGRSLFYIIRDSGSYFLVPERCAELECSMCWAALTLSVQLDVSQALFCIEVGVKWQHKFQTLKMRKFGLFKKCNLCFIGPWGTQNRPEACCWVEGECDGWLLCLVLQVWLELATSLLPFQPHVARNVITTPENIK